MIFEKLLQNEVLYDLYLVGKKVYDVIENCCENFIGCEAYISELNLLIIESSSNLTDDQKSKFRELALKNNFFFTF